MKADSLANELKHEAATTRRMLQRLPENLFDWKPHQKSTSLGTLAVHIADMIEWIYLALTTTELDYEVKGFTSFKPQSNEMLLEHFDRKVKSAIDALENASDKDLLKTWTVRKGKHIFFTRPRAEVIRIDCINHIIHHRGQLSVYMRLNDIPLPGIYGPTADT